MEDKNREDKQDRSLFKITENRENFDLLYKFLSQPAKGLSLCQALPEERLKIIGIFDASPLSGRIHRIDMVKPPRGAMELQQTIIDAFDKFGLKKDIFFIYNIEGCIHLLKTDAEDFFQGMNLIRDFFMQFKANFVFFVTEASVKKMIREAFDFYDWMRVTFTFVPESRDSSLRSIDTGKDKKKYSKPLEKIDYLEKTVKKVKNDKAKSLRLFELGKLYLQVGKYDEALERIMQSLEIEKKYAAPGQLAARYETVGSICKAGGKFDKALEFGLRALEIYEKNDDTINAAALYNNSAVLYQAGGESEKALDFAIKALEIFERNEEKDNAALVNSNIGKIYQSMGDSERAANYFERAVPAKNADKVKDDQDDVFRWKELLDRILVRNVIPVIGQGLYRVEIESEGKSNCLLYDYLAEQIAAECNYSLDPNENLKFAKACHTFLKKYRNDYIKLSGFLRKKLEGVRLVPGSALWKLARIKAFNIFITAAFDNFLSNTIKTVRDVQTHVQPYTINEKYLNRMSSDLFDRISNSQAILVFQVFGSIENVNPAYTERDILETLLELWKDITTGLQNHLFQILQKSNLLFLGCGYGDWLYRLFIRTIANKPYWSIVDYSNSYVADDFSNIKKDSSRELLYFLRAYGVETFHSSGSDFVDILFEKMEKTYPETIIQPSDFPFTVFISFEGRDRAAASRLASHLREDGIDVWFDEMEFKAGDELDRRIFKAIEQSPVFIPLISQNAKQFLSHDDRIKFHVREWERAYANKKVTQGIQIIPVRIDDSSWAYDVFREFHHLNIPGGHRQGDYNRLKDQLLDIQKNHSG